MQVAQMLHSKYHRCRDGGVYMYIDKHMYILFVIKTHVNFGVTNFPHNVACIICDDRGQKSPARIGATQIVGIGKAPDNTCASQG